MLTSSGRRGAGAERVLVCLAILLGSLAFPQTGHAASCDSGASPPKQEWCDFFVEYVPRGQRGVDPRIGSRFPPAERGDPEIRSFALVFNVSTYPKLTDPKQGDLVGVRSDLSNLVTFLKEQQFDEIIAVKDEAVTPDMIRDIFDLYIIPQLRIYAGRSRFLFAFDGHGLRGENPTLPGGLALSGTTGEGDSDPRNNFPLEDLRSRLNRVANFAYQSLALLGSCYSGGVFPPNPHGGQNYSYSLKPGAHVVTAARADRMAIAYPDGRGTVFFEALIRAIRQARPRSTEFSAIIDTNSETVVRNSAIVRLARAVDDVNEELEGHPYPQLSIGAMAPDKDYEGAFFFLGSVAPTVTSVTAPAKETKSIVKETADIARTTSELIQTDIVKVSSVTGATGSSLKSRPSVSIFNVPEAYKIRGVDLSLFNRSIDFDVLRKNDIRFAYLRATQGVDRVDPTFKQYRESAIKARLAVGAYHVFSFCRPVSEQMKNIIRNGLGNSPEMMPIAIDIEWYGKPALPAEESCNAIPVIRQRLLDLAAQIETYSGKRPIIYAGTQALRELIDDSFSKYSLWIADYSAKARSGTLPTKAANPWTLWQFTSEAEFSGIAGKIDLNAFFGTEAQFEKFKSGKENVALSATQ